MSREVFVYRNGRLVPKHEAEPPGGGSGGAYVISDTMPALRHPITREFMESKSQFRSVTRAHGCVEVGNERQKDTRRMSEFDKQSRINDIRRAITELGG